MSRGFGVLLVVSTLTSVSAGVAIPVIPRFVVDELHGGETLVGFIVGLTAFCTLISGLLGGPVVDRRGRRLSAAAGLAAAVAGALLLVPAAQVGPTVFARIVYGSGAGVGMVAVLTWAVDLVEPERRGRGLSILGATVWIGLSAGPQLGQAVLDEGGFRAVWLLTAGLELVALLLVLALPWRRATDAPVADPAAAWWRRLVPPGAARPGAAIALAAYGDGVLAGFLVLHLIDRGVPPDAGLGGAASVYTIFAASVLVLRVVGAQLIDRYPPALLAACALVLEAVGLLIIASASSFSAAAAGAATMGGGFAVLFPSLALLATTSSNAAERGAALGSFTASFSLGLALGSFVGGAIASLGGTAAAHASGAVAAGAAIALLVARPRHRRADGEIEPSRKELACSRASEAARIGAHRPRDE